MSSVPLSIARVPMQLSGSLLVSTLQNQQTSLLKVQQQLSTGQKLNRASDDPAAAIGIDSLKRQLAVNTGYSANLDFASGSLKQVDSSLGSLNDLIIQAQSIASTELNSTTSSDERAAQAEVVASLLSQAIDIGNQRYRGQAIFGGQNGAQDPFLATGGGYKYQGTTQGLSLQSPTGGSLEYTLSGDAAFGALSSQVVGYRSLTPALTSSTRLADLGGAQLNGINAGPLNLTVGASTVSVDLSPAASVGDVVNILNAALTSAGSNASIGFAGGSLVVTGDSTQTITLADSLSGTTAADLGIASTVAPTTTLTGAALAPKLTNTTTLASLNSGAGIDPSGIIISNGTNTATISLTGLNTVEDLLNAINGSGTNVRAEINTNGTGINIFNPLSGTALRIGENGGTTADDLGIRSLNAQTNLADLNGSTGVTPISGTLQGPSGQIVVTRTDGTQFNVAVAGIRTPSQLIAAINGAPGNSTVTAALNASGNGINLTDTTGGPGNLQVSGAATFVGNGTDLGVLQTGAGGSLTGTNITFSTDDFRITRKDGTSFTVQLTGAATIQDVLNRINTADGNTTPATQVTASLNPAGNGIQLSDASSGSGLLTVTALNGSSAATQLGIYKTAPSTASGLITGDDVNPLEPQGVLSSLALLRDSLLHNDASGIQRAATLLAGDGSRAVRARGVVGAREQDVASRQDDLSNEQTQLKQAMSLLADTDFTEAATRFQQLQTAYQASLQVASSTHNLSLLDFLK